MNRFAQKPRKWTTDEVEFVRRRYLTLSHKQIAAALGRTAKSVKSYCKVHRLVRDRAWSAADKRFVVRNYGTMTGPQMAVKLGRPLVQIHSCCKRIGLSETRPHHGPELIRFIREKHALGWSDVEIAAAWAQRIGSPVDRHTIAMRRAELGLCSNQFSDHYRRKVARKTREQLDRAGLRTLADVRTQVLAARVAAMGWPPNVCLREAQILSLIWERGPMTRKQICLGIGMKLHERHPKLMMHANEPGGTYTATLMRKGLLIKIGRNVRHPDAGKGNRAGQGKNVCLYSLPLNIKRRKVEPHEQHTQRQWPGTAARAGGNDGAAGLDAVHPGRGVAVDQARGPQGDHGQADRKGKAGRRARGKVRDGPGTQFLGDARHDAGPEQQLLQRRRRRRRAA